MEIRLLHSAVASVPEVGGNFTLDVAPTPGRFSLCYCADGDWQPECTPTNVLETPSNPLRLARESWKRTIAAETHHFDRDIVSLYGSIL